MVLYDNMIKDIMDLLPAEFREFPHKKTNFKNVGKNSVLLKKDTAFELGGSQTRCVNTLAITSTYRFENTVALYGPDLTEIKGDVPFGKIVFAEVADVDNDTDDDLFGEVKKLEAVRYSYCPEGFMARASAIDMREQIRVSKKAVKSKITFQDYGSAVIDEYLKNPIVKSVKVIFITEGNVLGDLHTIAWRIKDTTSALNHILDNVLFDCSTCNLKAICDEVEGLKEIHMQQAKKS